MEAIMDKVKKFTSKDVEQKLKQNYVKALQDENFKKLVSMLNVSEEVIIKNTSKLKKTAEQLENCKKCKSVLECNSEIEGFVYFPEVGDEKIIFSYVSCKHKRKFIKENSYLDNIYSFDMPKDIINAQMKNIYTDDKNRIEVIKWLKEFIHEYEPNKKIKGLYLHGNFGCGKTYLVSACFNELAKRGVKSAIVYWPEFLRKLKASFGNETSSFDELFNQIKEVPLLLLDDIGAENTTNWGRDEILGPILQYRMLEHLPTFFTSNLSLEELENHFALTKDSVDMVKSRRILERVKELSTEIKMLSENKRK